MQAKKFIPLVAFVVLAGLLFRGLSIDPTELPAARLGQSFPEFSQPELSTGRAISVEALALRPALVNVWATWCFACRIEHPSLNALAEQGVKIVGLNYKDQRDAAKLWLLERGNPYGFNIFDNQGSLGIDLGVYGAPETYLVDAQGIIRHRRVGVVDKRIWEEEFAALYLQLTGQAPVLGATQ